ncbi:MAG: 6-carboxytetrahydropterin synthase [Phycisphaerales bacterium]
MSGLGRYYELDVSCAGEPDPQTGYLIDIRQIDRVVRDALVPLIAEACVLEPQIHPARLLPSLMGAICDSPIRGIVEAVRWRLTPYYSVEMAVARTNRAIMRLKFDFAAAHRLHVPGLSDEINRTIFGRCNNPNGHGHNYQIEVAVAVPLDERRTTPTVAQVEQLVDAILLKPFDHKHLNLDTPEFAPEVGLNPSVENIARVFFDRLAGPLADAFEGAELASMTVWETDRTCCTFPAS